MWSYETPFAYVLARLPYWAYHNSWAYSWVAFKTASQCHFPRFIKPNCNELLDLGLLVRHPAPGPIVDAGIIDDLANSQCRTLMDYEVVVRKHCGAATSKFHYNYWVSRIRVGQAPPAGGGAAPAPAPAGLGAAVNAGAGPF